MVANSDSTFGTLAFGSAQTTYLRNDGQWEIPGSNQTSFYGECTTTASTQTKTVTISGLTTLTQGIIVNVKFTNTNTVSNPKLQINNLDAKNIVFYHGATGFNYNWVAGQVIQFIYDGTQFIQQDSFAYNVFEQYVPSFSTSCAILTATNATSQNATTPIYKNSICTINHATGTINANTFEAAQHITVNGNEVATESYVMSMILSAMSSSY